MITKLPIAIPSVYTYLHHANPLAVSELNPQSIPCLRNNFIQLYSIPTAPDFIIDFYHYDGMYPRYPFVDSSWVSARTLSSLGCDVVSQFKSMLDTNCYVEAYLNEVHLSASHAYQQKEDWIHNNMIFGYSDEAECFYAQGFMGQTFGKYEIPYAQIAPALPISSGVSLKSITPHAKYNNTLSFRKDIVAALLEDYLSNSNRFLTFKPQGAIYGQATYEIIVDQLEASGNAPIDIRPWHLYLEHKRKIRALANYVAECSERPLALNMEEGFKNLEEDAMNVRNYIIDCATRGRTVKIDALRRNVKVIMKAEYEILYELQKMVQSLNQE